MNRKKIIGIIAVAVILVFAVVVLGKKENSEQNDNSAESTTTEMIQNENNTQGEDIKDEEGNSEKAVESSTSDDTSKNQTDTTADTTKTTDETTETQDNTEAEAKRETIELPYVIPGSEVTIEYINAYSGKFLEDGSDEEVENVTAIKVKNGSEKVIEYGTIQLERGNKDLQFAFSDLPAGAEAIVLEANRTTYKKKSITYDTSSFAYLNEMSLMESEIKVEQADKNGLKIKNLTDNTIPTIRIFYKYRLESGEYIGGITYTCKIENLAAGESKTIYPAHYATDGSVVMMVRTYEE